MDVQIAKGSKKYIVMVSRSYLMRKNLLGKVLALSVSILGLLFFIYSLVSSYTEIDENNITTFEITGWLMLSLLIVPTHRLSFN